MIDPKEHISKIRREKYGLDENGRLKRENPLAKDLKISIQHLSEGLYSKNIHFIFELIQNAEDNIYDSKEPTLSFLLKKSDPTGTINSDGALIVQNNEIGFSIENVEKICSIGQTTKEKNQGYIGEKGIGFKSVFIATSNPHIFSNGYRFCLPKHNEETGLGYIVPQWIDKVPAEIDLSITTIILPLDVVSYSDIEKMLLDIEPETILFLSKIKEIQIKNDFGDFLTIFKDDSKAPLIQILVEGKKQNLPFCKFNEFLLHEKEFIKPQNIYHEKREKIENRKVAIAFSLDENIENAGKMFAYLPVHSNTGLPFLINADFILTSSREDVNEQERWNIWLMDCIAEAYIEAFKMWTNLREYRTKVFGSIPLKANSKFFNSVVEFIQNELSNLEIIPTEPDCQNRKPTFSRTASQFFRNLISGNFYPQSLLDTRIVLSEIEIYKDQLNSIGVKKLTINEIKSCFMEREWIAQHKQEWLIECYSFLSTNKFENTDLTVCPIVPIEVKGKKYLSCVSERPIYFERDKDFNLVLDQIPDFLQTQLIFLDPEFYEKVRDDKNITDWMKNVLKIKYFSKLNFIEIIINGLNANYENISDLEIISLTISISEFENDKIPIKDMPILLSDGTRMLLSEIKSLKSIQSLVTPVCLDPETGWQNIFVNEEDRKHFLWLSDKYIIQCDNSDSITNLKKLWDKLDITSYPLPFMVEIEENKNSLSRYEDNCIKDSRYSLRTKSIVNYRPVSWIYNIEENGNSELHQRSRSLIFWLTQQKNSKWQKAIVKKFNRYPQEFPYESEFLNFLKMEPWLPTSKGFERPNKVFIASQNLKEILGDSVPYFENALDENVCKLLEIRREATADELVSVLEQYALNKEGSKNFADRVYRYLNSIELSPNIIERIRQNNLLFMHNGLEIDWIPFTKAIWKDRSDVFGKDFYYLENNYPKLKDFLISTIGVKEDVDTECFAFQWLNLQKDSGRKPREIEDILTIIYREIRKICLIEEENRPKWWQKFISEVKIWTQNKTFEPINLVYVPDDGELKKIFQEKNILLAWRPEKDSFFEWETLYRVLGLKYLSENVKISMSESKLNKINKNPIYLTNASKILIIAWLMEERLSDYQRLQKENMIELFLNTNEVIIDSLKLKYDLKGIKVDKSSDSFWHIGEKMLLIEGNSTNQIKNTIARTLAKALLPNRSYKSLADWIELVLGEMDWKWRLDQKSWSIPDEINRWLHTFEKVKSEKQNETDHNATLDDIVTEQFKSVITGTKISEIGSNPNNKSKSAEFSILNQNQKEDLSNVEDLDEFKSIGSSNHNDSLNYVKELNSAFNRLGKKTQPDEILTQIGIVTNIDQRREKEHEAHYERFENEPDAEKRRRKTERTILEGPDEQVRKTLEEWYGGKCQICGHTFLERDGKSFFIANYMVSRKFARKLDTYANALCLCAEHFARWQHGSVEASDITDKILSLKCYNEGGKSPLCIKFKLCDEECSLNFNEKHLIALQELLNVNQANDVSDL